MTRHMRCCLVLTVALAAPVAAQEPSPHAAGRSDTVKTLTEDEVSGLLSGEGMGLARAAELNGYPGPRHVLDLADSLALTPEQRSATAALFEAMREDAIAVGRDVLEAERALDSAFQVRAPEAELQRLADRVAERRGALRWVHLRAHLRMHAILTPHQTHTYDRLRGYDGAGHQHDVDHGADHGADDGAHPGAAPDRTG